MVHTFIMDQPFIMDQLYTTVFPFIMHLWSIMPLFTIQFTNPFIQYILHLWCMQLPFPTHYPCIRLLPPMLLPHHLCIMHQLIRSLPDPTSTSMELLIITLVLTLLKIRPKMIMEMLQDLTQ